jgi:hypothetical protein
MAMSATGMNPSPGLAGGLRPRAPIPANQSYRIIKEERRTSVSRGGVMAKFHSRPSAQYRYEHYDPKA